MLSNRTLMRLQQRNLAFAATPIHRFYSTTEDYKNLEGHAIYQPMNAVEFKTDKVVLFDST